ncbi:RNA polymerase sigma factor [Peterkaempfera bronchialis]|uniref:RNA polymerase sigma factor n=1 Tax=Peterkaempfera bronchialis TaxID=2126346 RepID=A0A345T528_9ACTN|nr:RNA polymerase sigma factor [Peterkaempfera bronchialis]
MSDEALLAGLAARDPEIAAVFVRRFRAGIWGAAASVLHNPPLAEDVVQQTFEQALRHAHGYDPRRGSVRRWINVIAHNLAVDIVRSRRWSVPVDPEVLAVLGDSLTESSEEQALARESARLCRAAVAALPHEQRRALVMAGLYRMTAREVSESERIPLGTAKTRIRLAMGKVRAVLVGQGVGPG